MYKRLSYMIFTVSTLMLVALGATHAPQLTADTVPTGIYQLETSAEGIHFTLHTPTYEVVDGLVEANALEHRIEKIGAPQLPAQTIVVAVPPDADIQVKVNESPATIEKTTLLRPLGEAEVIRDADSGLALSLDNQQRTVQYDEAIYNVNQLFPAQSYTVSEPKYYRDVRLLEITLYPVRYNPATAEIAHISHMDVELTFTHNAQRASHIAPATADDSHLAVVQGLVINPEQARQWRGLPRTLNASRQALANLPIGQTSYKISLDENTLYDIRYADLAAVGYSNNHPFDQIQLMHRGTALPYQVFDNDNNSTFTNGDVLRFYGWAFDGSSFEKFYVNDNEFWLTFGASSASGDIPTAEATPANSIPITATAQTLIFTDELVIWESHMNYEEWEDEDNEPDYLYWHRVYDNSDPSVGFEANPVSFTLDIPLAVDGTYTAVITAEMQTTSRSSNSIPSDVVVRGRLDGGNVYSRTMTYYNNRDLTMMVPNSELADGELLLEFWREYSRHFILLNDLDITYMKYLQPEADQVLFKTGLDGTYDFQPHGFSSNNLIAWDVTNPRNPVRLTNTTAAGNALTFNRVVTPSSQFLVVAQEAIPNVAGKVTAYTAPDIKPEGGANWIAIAPTIFVEEAQELADYRTSQGYQTAVVDLNHIINQYGYGLPIPQAIQNYLKESLTWELPPKYVVLFGDGDYNPRLIECSPSCDRKISGTVSDWSVLNQHQIPTYLTFYDRFNGLAPSDYYYTLLVGDDLYPDLDLGRISVETEAEAETAVNKIKQYESNLISKEEWLKNMLFVYDDPDEGGNFYAGVLDTLNYIPDTFQPTLTGLTTGAITEVTQVRNKMFNTINMTSTSLLSWRGHGSITGWAGGGGNILKNTDMDNVSLMGNFDRPMFTLSLDCWDGNYAYPGMTSIGEAFLLAENGRGSAAHWSSTGLGYDFEHTYFNRGFFIGLFDEGITTIGDTVNFAKAYYLSKPFLTRDEVFIFSLQGDPAMQIYRPELSIEATGDQTTKTITETLDVTLSFANAGLYPSKATITYTLPAGMTYIDHTAALTNTHTITTHPTTGELILTFKLTEGLAYQQSSQIKVTVQGTRSIIGTSTAVINGPGLDLSPDTGRIATFPIRYVDPNNELPSVFLPLVVRP